MSKVVRCPAPFRPTCQPGRRMRPTHTSAPLYLAANLSQLLHYRTGTPACVVQALQAGWEEVGLNHMVSPPRVQFGLVPPSTWLASVRHPQC